MANQTSFALEPAIGVPGQLSGVGHEVKLYFASTAIPFGAGVVLDGEKVKLSALTSAIPANGDGSFAGVAQYMNTAAPGGYAIGDLVPVVRKGEVFALYTGSAAGVAQAAANLRHASDDTNEEAQYKGYFSDGAAATTDGSEISAVAARHVKAVSTTLALLELNLP